MSSETPPSESVEVPAHRTASMALCYVRKHVEGNLSMLHDMCVARGLSKDVEDGLRQHLLQELEVLSAMPDELTLLEKRSLEDTHIARADERDKIWMSSDTSDGPQY